MECKVTVRKSHYPKDVPFEVPEGWVWTTLDTIARFSGGKTPSMDDRSNWENGKHLWITSKDMKSEAICDSQIKLSDIGLQGMMIFSPGTILMVNRSGILRRTLPLGVLQKDATINQDLKAITPYIIGLTPYLFFCLKAFEPIILQDYKKAGTTVDNINFDLFVTIPIPLPPIQEQWRIVQSIQSWMKGIVDIEESNDEILNTIDSTKSKILELAIKGKLVPQDALDEPAIELLKRINPSFQASDNLHYEGVLPSGWTVCCLEDILDYEQPQAYIVNSTDYSYTYKTPVLTPGKSFVLGYTDELSGICNRLPVIIFDDFTTESKYVDFPFKVKSSAMKILRARGEINLRYVAIFMSITRLAGDTHKRYWISEYSRIAIPVPPLREQDRIVSEVQQLFYQLDNLVASISAD